LSQQFKSFFTELGAECGFDDSIRPSRIQTYVTSCKYKRIVKV
jgi:hypothetical protein